MFTLNLEWPLSLNVTSRLKGVSCLIYMYMHASIQYNNYELISITFRFKLCSVAASTWIYIAHLTPPNNTECHLKCMYWWSLCLLARWFKPLTSLWNRLQFSQIQIKVTNAWTIVLVSFIHSFMWRKPMLAWCRIYWPFSCLHLQFHLCLEREFLNKPIIVCYIVLCFQC